MLRVFFDFAKRICLLSHKYYIQESINYQYSRKIKKEIQTLKCNPLTSEQEKEVKDFFAQFGIRNVKTYWHQYYSHISGSFSKYYIPENIFYSIIEPHLNRSDYAKALSDKNLLNKWFKYMKIPETVIKNVNGIYFNTNDQAITKIDACQALIKQKSKMVIKPSINSFGGRNVVVFEIDHDGVTDYKKMTIDQLINFYRKNFIVQLFIEQHENLSKLNPSSVNTIRIMTLLMDGEIHVCNSRMRFGALGSTIDNTTNGGLTCEIKYDGTLGPKIYDGHGKMAGLTHCNIQEIKIPEYEILLQELKKSHIEMPFFKLISWDIAVDKQGKPVIVEYNVIGQGINSLQVTGFPLFGINTEKVLKQCVH